MAAISPDKKLARCNFNIYGEGQKYCLLHQKKMNVIDYVDVIDYNNIEKSPNNEKISYHNIFHSFDLADKKIIPDKKIIAEKKTTKKIIKEESVNNVIVEAQNDNDSLDIKLLILSNDHEYVDKLPKLIGPSFDDITKSDEQYDPVTYDEFWIENENGIRIPGSLSKYYTFSYFDQNNKLITFSIYTLNSIIESGTENGKFIHPVTKVEIPSDAIIRAKELVDLYKNKLGLLIDDESLYTPEFKLKKKMNNLFMKFHVHSIYMEGKWLIDIYDINSLQKIIKNTRDIVSNNKDLFGGKSSDIFESCNKTNILEVKEYIVSQWDKIITTSDPSSQMPAWIIISGMMNVVPDIKIKFPDVQLMME